MSINIQAKTDYSSLFSSLNSSGSSGIFSDMSWLSDYSSIKSGSYSKLMKAYYASGSEESSTSKVTGSTTSADKTVSANTKTVTNADALNESVTKLGELDSDADDAAVKKAIDGYVSNYNSLIKSVADTGDTTLSNRINTIENYTAENTKKLNEIGITVNNDGTLNFKNDEETTVNRDTLNSLFASRNSYGYSVKVSASMIQSTANYNASKESTYTNLGTYSSVVGSLWDTTT